MSAPGEEFPEVGVDVFEKAAGTEGTADPQYQEALNLGNKFAGGGGNLGTLEKWDLDALAVPTTPWTTLRAAAIRGLPIVSVPLGFYPEETLTTTQEDGKLVYIAPNVPYVS